MDTILNSIRVAGNVLSHSLRTVPFCWAVVGLAVVFLAIRGVTKRKSGKKRENDSCLEGMCLGMCFGLLIGTMPETCIGAAVSLGMIAGLAVGMLLPGNAQGAGE